MKILLKNACVIKNQDEVMTNTDIYLNGNIIEKIDKNLSSSFSDKVIDCTDKIVFPGLINCHTHNSMILMRNFADDISLNDWLYNNMFPLEEGLDEEMCYYASLLAMVEMIKTGTTCFNDMYFFMNATKKAKDQIGLRGVVSRSNVGDTDISDMDIRTKEAIELFETANDGDMTKVFFAPHAMYTCSTQYLKKTIYYAKKYNTRIHVHLAETKKEFDDSLKEHGMTPVEYFESIGMFEVPTVLAHAVHVTDSDIEILKKYDTSIVHNPASNMKLASGVARIKDFMDSGINVCLGTDGAGSNNNMDLLIDARLASYMQKVTTLDPKALSAKEAFKMLTQNGARALGYSHLGEIKEGFLADLVILNSKNSYYYPKSDMVSQLIYSANSSDVETVIINGNIVMENKKFNGINEEDLYNKVEESYQKLYKIFKDRK